MEKIPEKAQKRETKREEFFEKARRLQAENQILRRELKDKEEEIRALKKRTNDDLLTGLFNRRSFKERAEKMIREIRFSDKFPEKRREEIKRISLLFIDIDDFKKINDTYGHSMGDEVLKIVGKTISRSVRSEDIAGRWGGEEFLVVLANASEEEAKRKSEKLGKLIEEIQIKGGGETIKVTVSIGVAALGKNEPLEKLVERADKAMYKSKELGKNRVTVASEVFE